MQSPLDRLITALTGARLSFDVRYEEDDEQFLVTIVNQFDEEKKTNIAVFDKNGENLTD